MNKFKIYSLALFGALIAAVAVLLHRGGDDVAPVQDSAPLPELNKAESNIEVAAPTPLVVREAVLQLAGLFGDGALPTRRDALAALPQNLNAKELETIYVKILERSRPEDIPLRPWHGFFNDVLNALVLYQKVPVADLPDRLAAIVNDAERHRVIRDYALQHLLAYTEYRMEGTERIAILEQTWSAISETRDSYRGTYLVALSYKAGEPGWPAAEDVSVKAWEVASAVDAHVLSRITALQVCGKLGYQEALPLALKIASDTNAHMTLRTSAIATIGDLGSVPERAILASLAERSPPRLLVAIEAALMRIEAKETQV